MTHPIVLHGNEPLIVSIPHAGIEIPPDIGENLASLWLARQDADWYVDRLYDFAGGLGATVIRTAISRTIIDVNRDPTGKSLYPGQATTELCPTITFDGVPLYKAGRAPDEVEITRRRKTWFAPYHQTVGDEIARLRKTYRRVILFDAHSIRPHVPRLFEGTLPDLNFGTNKGASCAPELTARIEEIAADSTYSHVTNGRFKGGHITRHYGHPNDGVHAFQLEISTSTYLGKQPQTLSEKNWPPEMHAGSTARLKIILNRMLHACIAFAKDAT